MHLSMLHNLVLLIEVNIYCFYEECTEHCLCVVLVCLIVKHKIIVLSPYKQNQPVFIFCQTRSLLINTLNIYFIVLHEKVM